MSRLAPPFIFPEFNGIEREIARSQRAVNISKLQRMMGQVRNEQRELKRLIAKNEEQYNAMRDALERLERE